MATTAAASTTRRVRTTLPRLLATLPSLPTSYPTASSSPSSDPILVQPLEWRDKFPDSFFRVYRTKLRAKAPGAKGRTALGEEGVRAIGANGPAKEQARAPVQEEPVEEEEAQEEEEDLFALAESSEEGGNEAPRKAASSGAKGSEQALSGTVEVPAGVQVFGKAWGVLFWKGKPVQPHNTTYELSPDAIRQRYPHIRTTSLSSDPTSPSSPLTTPPAALPTLPTPYVPATLINPRLAVPMTRANWRLVPPTELEGSVLEAVRQTHAGPRIDGPFGDRAWNEERTRSRKERLKIKNRQRREERRGTVVAGAQ